MKVTKETEIGDGSQIGTELVKINQKLEKFNLKKENKMDKKKRFFTNSMISIGLTLLIIGFQEIIALFGSAGRIGDFQTFVVIFIIAIVLLIIGFIMRKKMDNPTPIISYILIAIGLYIVYYIVVESFIFMFYI